MHLPGNFMGIDGVWYCSKSAPVHMGQAVEKWSTVFRSLLFPHDLCDFGRLGGQCCPQSIRGMACNLLVSSDCIDWFIIVGVF